MLIKVLSDMALVIEVADAPDISGLAAVRTLVRRLTGFTWLAGEEIVAGLTAVAVHLRSDRDIASFRDRLLIALAEPDSAPAESGEERERVIPVVYGSDEGPDLQRVADHAGISVEEVIRRHGESEYRVATLGFAPGFPYLSGLDPALACPRLDSPRLRVPAGAVGIGGTQTGVYPQELPGGWNLIGRTNQRLFDPDAVEPSWFRPGDRVRFERVPELLFSPLTNPKTLPQPRMAAAPNARVITVEEGGAQTTVQDLGRPGYQLVGVAPGGALNQRALAVANLLVGNAAGAPALEWALQGPVLCFQAKVLVAITGTPGLARPFGQPFWMRPGEVLDLRKLPGGGRGYLAVGGGFYVPVKLGSASTHLSARFGGFRGRALRSGDQLMVGPSKVRDIRRGWGLANSMLRAPSDETTEIRVIPGPELESMGSTVWQTLLESEYQISADSNRMGLRLEGPVMKPSIQVEMTSQPVALGAIQLPPNGQPLVLMADRQSVGGYPRIAGVISADISLLAQVPLGGNVSFVEVTLSEAIAARRRAARDLGFLQVGLRNRLISAS